MRSAPIRATLVAAVLVAAVACGARPAPEVDAVMTVKELLALPQPPADVRIPYGADPLQFGDLRLPPGEGPFAVAVLVHGGCWLAPYDLSHLSSLAAALTAEGVATWSLEYRRVGDEGGGWPGTFLDVARGVDHLRALASVHQLDLGRVVFVGHSAGGHLALWLAARPQLPEGAPGAGSELVRPRGVVSLAGIPDLALGAELQVCGDAISELLGGEPAALKERLALASPSELVPLGVPLTLVIGGRDQVVPGDLAAAFASQARAAGDRVSVHQIPVAGHYELVTPGSVAWATVRDAVLGMVDR